MSALVPHASLDPLPSEVTFSIYVLRHRGIPHDAAGWAQRNIPVFIGGPVGPGCSAAPLVRSTSCPASGRGRSGGMTGPCWGPCPFH